MMYAVGERYREFVGEDGVFLSVDEGGLVLLCRMSRPTSEEKNAFYSRKQIRIGMGVVGCVMYWTVRFDKLPAMDCTYSPQLASMGYALTPIVDSAAGYALTVMLADAATGELLRLRVVGLPHDFSKAVREAVDAAAASAEPYHVSINRIYALSTEELEARAEVRCNVG